MTEVTTTDLSKFGSRERSMLVDLLVAWNNDGLPEDFWNDEVVPTMNTDSGFVFLTNSDYQVAMMNGDKIEVFYICPHCDEENFRDDLEASHGPDAEDECRDWFCQMFSIDQEEPEEEEKTPECLLCEEPCHEGTAFCREHCHKDPKFGNTSISNEIEGDN